MQMNQSTEYSLGNLSKELIEQLIDTDVRFDREVLEQIGVKEEELYDITENKAEVYRYNIGFQGL